ncbi:MAG: NIPSNAP family protein [Candidatus Eisenbacteria bacterium]
MKVQLRTYRIRPGSLDLFAEEWRGKIRPLRLKLGFEIVGAWKVAETSEFVWILSYDGPEEWSVLDRAYHESEERRRMDPDPARLIQGSKDHWIEDV